MLKGTVQTDRFVVYCIQEQEKLFLNNLQRWGVHEDYRCRQTDERA